jgi:hypothetical protein
VVKLKIIKKKCTNLVSIDVVHNHAIAHALFRRYKVCNSPSIVLLSVLWKYELKPAFPEVTLVVYIYMNPSVQQRYGRIRVAAFPLHACLARR